MIYQSNKLKGEYFDALSLHLDNAISIAWFDYI